MCAPLPIRAERRENGSEFVETLNADFGLPERHARAVPSVKHPVREFAAKVRSFVRVDERQVLAATKRRDLQRVSVASQTCHYSGRLSSPTLGTMIGAEVAQVRTHLAI